MNPFGDLSFCHSTWLVILLNYNLPPWLVTKCYFLMLALFILGKEFIIFANVDVYLEHLIKELQCCGHVLNHMVQTRGQHLT